MIGFGEGFAGVVAAVAVPVVISLSVIGLLPTRASKYLAAFGLGVFVVYFSDTFADSAYLDLGEGLGGGGYQLALILMVAAGLLVFAVEKGPPASSGGNGILIPLAVALALGLHGFGEGSSIGATASNTRQTDLLAAFGGSSLNGQLQQTFSFMLHKGLEAAIVGACTVGFLANERRGRRLVELLSVGGLFFLPSVVGFATGYYIAYDSTFVYALALGASLYVLFRVAKGVNGPGGEVAGVPLGISASLFLGFIMIYIASALH